MLGQDNFVIPRDDAAIGVETNLLIGDHGVAVMFAGHHFVTAAVLQANGPADSLGEERGIESHSVGAVSAVATGAFHVHDLNVAGWYAQQRG